MIGDRKEIEEWADKTLKDLYSLYAAAHHRGLPNVASAVSMLEDVFLEVKERIADDRNNLH